jgi:superfamily II DNA or RNA helicase
VKRQLRPYQREAVAAVQKAWAEGQLRPAVVMATGLGKSSVIAQLVADHVGQPNGLVNGKPEQRGRRVLILAHRHELLEQLKDNVLAVEPGVTVGIVQAERNETGPDVVIGSIQTLANAARLEQIKDVGLVVVDECHHSVARTYMETLARLGCFSDTIAVGATATMDRSDQKMLADVWESVAYSKGIREGIAEGHLVRPIGKAVVLESLDLSQVKTSKGDFQEGQLGEAIEEASVDIAKAVTAHAAGRYRILVFVPTVASANRLSDQFEDWGLATEVVVGTTDKLKRSFIYQSLRDGDIRVIVSVGVLTEGFDLPAIDCIVMARPTQSASLYQQCIGRGLRPSPETGKTDCLVLDVCDVNRIHTLRTLDKLVPESPYMRVGRDDDELPQELAEAIEASTPVEKIELEGVVIDRDLFGDSEALWLRTNHGTRFIPAGDWLIFLWEEDDRFRIGQLGARGPKLGGWLKDGGLYADENLADTWSDLPAAKAVAEDRAHGLDASLSSRAAPWRKGTRAPSEAQIRYAQGLGIRNPEMKSKSRLSDDISQALASYRLDV